MIKRKRWWIICGAALLSLALVSTGCGKKADPRYRPDTLPGKISNLTVSVDDGKAILEWSIPDQRERAPYVRIFRSALKRSGGDCPGCPRIYAILDYLPLRDALSTEEGKCRYVDGTIRRGFIYSYRLVLCTSSDTCGEQSNTAEVVIP